MPNLGVAEVLILCIVFLFIGAAITVLAGLLIRLSRRRTGDQVRRDHLDLVDRVARLENERQRPN
jgi:hypothetical protein